MMSSVDSRRPLRRDLLVRARELISKERPPSERFTLGFARDRSDLIEVQRLRYRVFAGEMGARLDCPIPGIDADLFDMYCDHLLVRETQTREVVGTYRLLRPEQAQKLGRCYSDGQFDLSRFASIRPSMVELGRACVAAPYRTGAVIRLLWSGIGAFLREHQYGYLVGTASVGTRDGGRLAASVYLRMAAECMASGAFAVTPRVRFPIEQTTPYLDPDIPPLIKGYMRAGGRVCGAPAWDRAFGTADFLMLLDLRELAPGHARRFISDDGSTENARPPRRSPEREVALVV